MSLSPKEKSKSATQIQTDNQGNRKGIAFPAVPVFQKKSSSAKPIHPTRQTKGPFLVYNNSNAGAEEGMMASKAIATNVTSAQAAANAKSAPFGNTIQAYGWDDLKVWIALLGLATTTVILVVKKIGFANTLSALKNLKDRYITGRAANVLLMKHADTVNSHEESKELLSPSSDSDEEEEKDNASDGEQEKDDIPVEEPVTVGSTGTSTVPPQLLNLLGAFKNKERKKKDQTLYAQAVELQKEASAWKSPDTAEIESRIHKLLTSRNSTSKGKSKKKAKTPSLVKSEPTKPVKTADPTYFLGTTPFQRSPYDQVKLEITTTGGGQPMIVLPCRCQINGHWITGEIHGHIDIASTTGDKRQKKYTHFARIHFKSDGKYFSILNNLAFAGTDIEKLAGVDGQWKYVDHWRALIEGSNREYNQREKNRNLAKQD